MKRCISSWRYTTLTVTEKGREIVVMMKLLEALWGIFVFAAGLVAVSVVSSIVFCLVAWLWGTVWGCHILQAHFLWFACIREGEKLCFHRERFSPLASIVMGNARNKELILSKKYCFFRETLNFLFVEAGHVLILCLLWNTREKAQQFIFLTAVYLGLAILTNGIYLLYSYIKVIYRLFCNNVDLDLDRRLLNMAKGLMAGHAISEYEMQLKEEISLSPYPMPGGTQKPLYVLYQYYYALEKKDMEGVKCAMDKIMYYLPGDKLFDDFLAGFYAECVFYCGSILHRPEQAELYVQLSPRDIALDYDLNGRRIYAYYLYDVKHDRRGALKAIEEGFAVSGDYVDKGKIEMERELLYELKQKIEMGT